MKNLRLKSLFAISAILIFNLTTVQAATGVIEIIMRSSNGSDTELITIQAETNKFHSIVLVSQTGETITKTIRLTSRELSINFDLPKGVYQIFVVDVETGIKQKHTTLLH